MVWHPDVEAYDVFDGSRILGRIYLDMHPRANKYKHYAQFTLVPGKADVALPEAVLVCNFPQPKEVEPGLMQHQDVVTFFHEFGHLAHAVLGGQQKWSGADVEWDSVEAPSQMLEEWARDPKGLDTTTFSAQQQEKHMPFKYVPGTHFQTAFGHLDGYSAIYYTYMWSLVIVQDMYSAFTAEGDIIKPDAAMKYRKYVLEATGTKPAANPVQDFLGRPYAFKVYEDWLNAK